MNLFKKKLNHPPALKPLAQFAYRMTLASVLMGLAGLGISGASAQAATNVSNPYSIQVESAMLPAYNLMMDQYLTQYTPVSEKLVYAAPYSYIQPTAQTITHEPALMGLTARTTLLPFLPPQIQDPNPAETHEAELQSTEVEEPTEEGLLSFITPVNNPRISSSFGMRGGRMHQGIDYAVPNGTPIMAAEKGTVTYSGWESGYGNFVIIDHGDGIQSRYGHASKLLVKEGESVDQGQTIALVGSTGHSTGPHLHFEVMTQQKHRNPIAYVNHDLTIQAALN